MKQQRQQEIEITITDHKQMCGIIDVASTRGAFRANELAGVGILHNKLSEYIKQNENSTVNGPNTPNIPNQPEVKKNEK